MNTPHLLLSPNGQMDAAHETASNHSGNSSINNNHHHHQDTQNHHHQDTQNQHHHSEFSNRETVVFSPQSATSIASMSQLSNEKNFKTEYKSRFKPFSEYAYNEVTDSFVKCHHSPADCSISASRLSNQDLSGATAASDAAHQHQITISTHDADVFEPSHDGSESHAGGGGGGSVAEPWYKEVVKRNEKANEYRFKSEVGHNSPLLNNYTTRSGSPFQSQFATNEPRLTSPSGNESLVGGGAGDNNTNIEIMSQTGDHQPIDDLREQQQPTVAVAKVQYRFTPSSYKRDNLIAHMANNNNFNLPKEHQEVAKSQQPRRAITASSQVRARSQSSRRPPTTSINTTNSGANRTKPVVHSSTKTQSTTKSNNTTPTRGGSTALRSNFTMRPTNAPTSKSHSKTLQAAAAPASRYATTTRTAASANGSGNTASKTPTGRASKRSPTVPAAAAAAAAPRVTPKPISSSTNHSSNRTPTASSVDKTATTKPASTARPKTAAPSRPLAASAGAKTEQSVSSKMSGIKAGKLPVTNARAPPNTSRAPAPASKTATSKTTEDNTTIKSIKTGKAIESDTAKAAAAAVVAAAAGVAVATGASSELGPSGETNESTQQQQQATAPEAASAESGAMQPPRYVSQEQNLIFTTTEGGDMLADELAQAELASQYEQHQTEIATNTSEQLTQDGGQNNEAVYKGDGPNDHDDDVASKQPIDAGQSGELVNGLAGGLVSAEDIFDSSEKDYSVDANNFQQQQHQQQQQLQQEHNYNDEPYSIIPTAADIIEDNKQPAESSLNDEAGPGLTFEIMAAGSTADDDKGDDISATHVNSTQKISGANSNDTNNDDGERLKFDNYSTLTDTSGDELRLEPSSQAKSDDDLKPYQRQSENQADESESDLMAQPDRVDAQSDYLNPGAALEVSPVVETPPQQHDIIISSTTEVTPQAADISSSSILTDEPNCSPIAASKHSMEDDDYNNSDEIHVNQDTRVMQEVPLDGDATRDVYHHENSGDISNDDDDERLEQQLTNNLTGSDHLEANITSKPATLETANDGLTMHQADKSNLDLMDQDDLMGAAVHSVDSFNAASEFKTVINDENPFLKSTNDSDDIPDCGTDSKVNTGLVERQEEEEEEETLDQQFDLIENLNELMADEIEVDFFADNNKNGFESTMPPDVTQKISQINLDDIDDDEHLKLSNNLTNSDDELILKPGNLKSDDDDLTPTPQQKDHDDKIADTEDRSESKADLMPRSFSEAFRTTTPVDQMQTSKSSTEAAADDDELDSDQMSNILLEAKQFVLASDPDPDDVARELVVDSVVPDITTHEIISQANLVDDDDDDCSSGHVDNIGDNLRKNITSDDGLILKPGNLDNLSDVWTTMPKQQQAGESDLDLMAQEDRLEGTVELGDGSSAALEIPTSIENRIEMSTSKSTDEPDMPQANFRFARKISDDSDEELDIDPDEDPIGSAATLSPNTSVADELMRFNAVKDNVRDLDLNFHTLGDDNQRYMTDLTSGSHRINDDDDDRMRNNNGSTKGTPIIEPVNVKSHVIDETVKQLSEQK